jgi:hypothetical protein
MKWGVLPTVVAETMEEGGAIALRSGLRAAVTAHAGVGIATAMANPSGKAPAEDVVRPLSWQIPQAPA